MNTPFAVDPMNSILVSADGGGCGVNDTGGGTNAEGSELRRLISVPMTPVVRARLILLG